MLPTACWLSRMVTPCHFQMLNSDAQYDTGRRSCWLFMLSEQAANYSVIGNCILGMSRYATRRRRFLIFLYTHPSVLHMRTILITLFPGGSPSNPHTIFYGKDIVNPKCHRNVRAIHPIGLKTARIVTKLGHFKIFNQYPYVTAEALWYPQWTIARFF